MSRKHQIIELSIKLFNEGGFFNVAIKDIADAMDISPGNLTYHFNKKEDILAAIQSEIITSGSDLILPKDTYITLSHFGEMFTKYYNVQKQYRFYFNEMQYLLSEYPNTMKSYKDITKHRFSDARKLVDYYIDTERLVPENDTIQYEHLIHSLWMTATFWSISSSLIDETSYQNRKFNTPVAALWHMLLPFLTEKGHQEYLEIKRLNKVHY